MIAIEIIGTGHLKIISIIKESEGLTEGMKILHHTRYIDIPHYCCHNVTTTVL